MCLGDSCCQLGPKACECVGAVVDHLGPRKVELAGAVALGRDAIAIEAGIVLRLISRLAKGDLAVELVGDGPADNKLVDTGHELFEDLALDFFAHFCFVFCV